MSRGFRVKSKQGDICRERIALRDADSMLQHLSGGCGVPFHARLSPSAPSRECLFCRTPQLIPAGVSLKRGGRDAIATGPNDASQNSFFFFFPPIPKARPAVGIPMHVYTWGGESIPRWNIYPREDKRQKGTKLRGSDLSKFSSLDS